MNLDQPLNLFRKEWGGAGATVLLVVIFLFAFLIHMFSFKILEKWTQRLQMPIGHMLYTPLCTSTQYVLLIMSVVLISPVLRISFNQAIDHMLTILLIVLVANLLIKAIAFGRSIFISRYDLTSTNKLYARKVFT